MNKNIIFLFCLFFNNNFTRKKKPIKKISYPMYLTKKIIGSIKKINRHQLLIFILIIIFFLEVSLYYVVDNDPIQIFINNDKSYSLTKILMENNKWGKNLLSSYISLDPKEIQNNLNDDLTCLLFCEEYNIKDNSLLLDNLTEKIDIISINTEQNKNNMKTLNNFNNLLLQQKNINKTYWDLVNQQKELYKQWENERDIKQRINYYLNLKNLQENYLLPYLKLQCTYEKLHNQDNQLMPVQPVKNIHNSIKIDNKKILEFINETKKNYYKNISFSSNELLKVLYQKKLFNKIDFKILKMFIMKIIADNNMNYLSINPFIKIFINNLSKILGTNKITNNIFLFYFITNGTNIFHYNYIYLKEQYDFYINKDCLENYQLNNKIILNYYLQYINKNLTIDKFLQQFFPQEYKNFITKIEDNNSMNFLNQLINAILRNNIDEIKTILINK